MSNEELEKKIKEHEGFILQLKKNIITLDRWSWIITIWAVITTITLAKIVIDSI